jgi:hypothetical protein
VLLFLFQGVQQGWGKVRVMITNGIEDPYKIRRGLCSGTDRTPFSIIGSPTGKEKILSGRSPGAVRCVMSAWPEGEASRGWGGTSQQAEAAAPRTNMARD